MKRRIALFLNRFKFSKNWRWVNRECLEVLVERMIAERVVRLKELKRLQEEKSLKNAEEHEAAIKERQDRCSHLKGGRIPLRYKKDYAVGKHTFIDGHVKVWCLVCGKQFDPNGEEARMMLKDTTNSPSSSEQVIKIEDRIEPLKIFAAPRKEFTLFLTRYFRRRYPVVRKCEDGLTRTRAQAKRDGVEWPKKK